jgi:hypothetical protein
VSTAPDGSPLIIEILPEPRFRKAVEHDGNEGKVES